MHQLLQCNNHSTTDQQKTPLESLFHQNNVVERLQKPNTYQLLQKVLISTSTRTWQASTELYGHQPKLAKRPNAP